MSIIHAVAPAAIFKGTLSSPFGNTIPQVTHGYLNALFSPGSGEGRRQQINKGRWGSCSCPFLPFPLPCLLQANSCHAADVYGPTVRTPWIEAISFSHYGKGPGYLLLRQQLELDSVTRYHELCLLHFFPACTLSLSPAAQFKGTPYPHALVWLQ